MNLIKTLLGKRKERPSVKRVVAGLTLPDELLALIASGRWPVSKEEILRQNLQSRVPPELVQRIAPDESRIHFDPPPFATAEILLELPEEVAQMFHGAPDPESPPGDIIFSKAILIGDFGPGSDAPIALDYRHGTSEPTVIRLRWSQFARRNRWVSVAPSFGHFAQRLKL